MIGRDNTTGGEEAGIVESASNSASTPVVYRCIASSALGSVIKKLSGLRSFGVVRVKVKKIIWQRTCMNYPTFTMQKVQSK